MKLILAFPALGLLLCGALLPKNQFAAPTTALLPTLPAPPALTAKMWVKKSTLYQGETLELHFQAPNAPYLGVIDPTGHFFYIVFPAEASVGKLKPLVDSQKFEPLSLLSISLTDFKADPYTYGVYENQAVFTQSGTFTFLLGDNLHTEEVTGIETLTVQYHHQPRPRQASTEVVTN